LEKGSQQKMTKRNHRPTFYLNYRLGLYHDFENIFV
jgi:hypothetical protein